MRQAIFETTDAYITDINSQNLAFRVGHNWISDLTQEERNSMLGYKTRAQVIEEAQSGHPKLLQVQKEPLILKSAYYGKNINWVTGITYPVFNQGACAAGWAFSTAGAIASATKIKYGANYFDLSAQQLISCTGTGSGYLNNGCQGGSISTSMMYTDDVPLETEAVYGYNSAGG